MTLFYRGFDRAKIAEGVKGRTADHVKTRFYSLKRKEKSGKPTRPRKATKAKSLALPRSAVPKFEKKDSLGFLNEYAMSDDFRTSGTLAGMSLTEAEINGLTSEVDASMGIMAGERASSRDERFSLSDALGDLKDAPFPSSFDSAGSAGGQGDKQRDSLGMFMNELDGMPLKQESPLGSSKEARPSSVGYRGSSISNLLMDDSDTMNDMLGDLDSVLYDPGSGRSSGSASGNRLSDQLSRMSF
jgi:hypothetical protein